MLCGAALVADAGNDARPEAADVPSGADKTVATILGEIVWLMSQSAEFKQYLISDLEWLVMPPILLRQFRLFYHNGQPVAAVLYGRFSDELMGKALESSVRIAPDAWSSGNNIAIVKTISIVGQLDKFEESTISALKGK